MIFLRLFPICLLIGFLDASPQPFLSEAIEGISSSAGNAVQAFVNATKKAAEKINEGAFEIKQGILKGLQEVVGDSISLEDLTFHLVTSKDANNATKLDFYDPGSVWNTRGKLYFLMHGWRDSKNADWVQDASRSLVTRDPEAQVVQVDWEKPASALYAFSAFETESAGDFLGIFINTLITNYNVSKENIVLVGHSLGGHIAGWAGKKFQKLAGSKLPRILALDPAGPLFNLRPKSRRLNGNDAEVVMAIHTDGLKLGFPSVCGTIDFFPNGGDQQAGCWKIELGNLSTYTGPVTCDHSRAWQFFMESIEQPGSFPSRKCSSYRKFKRGQCRDNLVVAMNDMKTSARGKFYLETNSETPYSEPLNDENALSSFEDAANSNENASNSDENTSNAYEND